MYAFTSSGDRCATLVLNFLSKCSHVATVLTVGLGSEGKVGEGIPEGSKDTRLGACWHLVGWELMRVCVFKIKDDMFHEGADTEGHGGVKVGEKW